MNLSSFNFILILLFIFSIEILHAQFWPSSGRCWGRFEEYRECASTCPDTCNDIRWPNPAKICTLMCKNGCDCIWPFVRLNQNPMSPCVHPRQCLFMKNNFHTNHRYI